MIRLSAVFLILFTASTGFYLYNGNDMWETLSITFGVTSYHFVMRLLTGYVLDGTLHNDVDHTRKWFREKPFERRLYRMLKVKKWKKYMPAFEPEYFDFKSRSAEELIKAGCQAEIVHEAIMVLSFCPTALCIWFAPGAVFVITSVLSALLDSVFVIMQRYNRPRLLRVTKQ